jgi:TetR/AcrR family transcriptional repressor of mexJK operon
MVRTGQLVDDGESATATPRTRGRPPADPGPRRSRIVAAATDLFIANGFAGTTLDLVARQSGLNKRTIYGLFGDKERLFREVCRHVGTNGELDLGDAIDPKSLRNSLLGLGRSLLDNSLSERTIALEKTAIAASRKFPDLLDEIVAATYHEANTKVSDFFLELQQYGLVVIHDHAGLGDMFFDIVVGQLAHRMVLGQKHFAPAPGYLEHRVDFFIKGYLTA